MPADIDETPQKSEHPRSLAKRLSKGKAEVAVRRLRQLGYGPATVLAADTVVSVGRQIMPKAELEEDALANLRSLSGRTHRVYTGVCVIGTGGALRQRLIETRVRFKRLSRLDIQSYLASEEWRGKAGGYAIQGLAGSFVLRLVGSYTNVVGLPLAETLALLSGEGYDIHARWRVPRIAAEDENGDPDEAGDDRLLFGDELEKPERRRSSRLAESEPDSDDEEFAAAEDRSSFEEEDGLDGEERAVRRETRGRTGLAGLLSARKAKEGGTGSFGLRGRSTAGPQSDSLPMKSADATDLRAGKADGEAQASDDDDLAEADDPDEAAGPLEERPAGHGPVNTPQREDADKGEER